LRCDNAGSNGLACVHQAIDGNDNAHRNRQPATASAEKKSVNPRFEPSMSRPRSTTIVTQAAWVCSAVPVGTRGWQKSRSHAGMAYVITSRAQSG